jgi:hypothetical protein
MGGYRLVIVRRVAVAGDELRSRSCGVGIAVGVLVSCGGDCLSLLVVALLVWVRVSCHCLSLVSVVATLSPSRTQVILINKLYILCNDYPTRSSSVAAVQTRVFSFRTTAAQLGRSQLVVRKAVGCGGAAAMPEAGFTDRVVL